MQGVPWRASDAFTTGRICLSYEAKRCFTRRASSLRELSNFEGCVSRSRERRRRHFELLRWKRGMLFAPSPPSFFVLSCITSALSFSLDISSSSSSWSKNSRSCKEAETKPMPLHNAIKVTNSLLDITGSTRLKMNEIFCLLSTVRYNSLYMMCSRESTSKNENLCGGHIFVF